MTETSEKPVIETRKGKCVWLTLNRPQVKNAMNGEMIAMLVEAFQRLGKDPETRAIVLAANGDAFCSGADLGYMMQMAQQAAAASNANQTSAITLTSLFRGIAECPKPVVARVHGLCLAGATGLVSASDIVVASNNVKFSLPEVKRGLIPATISPYVVQAMGVQAARRYFITGETFTAEKAHQLGMVHELTSPDTLDAKLESILAELDSCAPDAMAACKQLVRDVSRMDITADETHVDVAARLAAVRGSAEAAEGMMAFMEKRKPKWVG
ncbi:MAG: enoyl-CoA hydratase/isomerase family protein [Gammaproteobacteria bacterium]|uniref:enoyl-CoA hydratase-related protein n=1 Tax=Limnobacter sp. TaxID=2003368 RepID=UPI001D482370|nr:enoyl-CoA hydratase-related protein [Limnobacter sp.]MBU0784338.1 enoyl-CoA hydratase/isomerase family protein [Gammaproteobacteria bacterium]MBU0848495.1 enoyl-CoA hydratase/isomerase family protein [Gammaproteobacteria bacterium]MBU1267368.1 enoyl-CoA hydratase/isomerase family protein [Gammaproteobacteria bacterium]MBU1530393.1 enoyl-CoA hydratase/isomerase family protein [Gammaproteobacteria bacterium]MBU1780296.1 enoyl-CoA hydratase/isomerase family protein [Gammaproteobacteria bacteri